MARMRARDVVLTTVGVLIVGGALFGLLLVINADEGFAGCTGTTRFGWIAPLLAASIIGGLAWILLGQEPHGDGLDAPPAASCTSCGREVLDRWRLCPYCGTMLHLESTNRGESPEFD